MDDAGGEAGVVLFLGVEDVFFPTKRSVWPGFVGKIGVLWWRLGFFSDKT